MQHEGICAFPSMEFYEKKLKTWQGLRRPPSILGHVGKESCSVIFGHVQGHEQSLLVSTDEGNENSKANPEEVAAVVSASETFLVPQGQGGLPGGGGRGTEGTARPWCPGQERHLGQLQQHPLGPSGPHCQAADSGQDGGAQGRCHPHSLQCSGCGDQQEAGARGRLRSDRVLHHQEPG